MFNRFIKLLLTSVFESKHDTYHLPSKTVRHYITPLILKIDKKITFTCLFHLIFQSFFNNPKTTWKSQRLQRELDLLGFSAFACQFQIHNDTQVSFSFIKRKKKFYMSWIELVPLILEKSLGNFNSKTLRRISRRPNQVSSTLMKYMYYFYQILWKIKKYD